MFKKKGKYFADWRDEKGVRRRKAFTHKARALNHERKMKAARGAKQQDPKQPTPSRKRGRTPRHSTAR